MDGHSTATKILKRVDMCKDRPFLDNIPVLTRPFDFKDRPLSLFNQADRPLLQRTIHFRPDLSSFFYLRDDHALNSMLSRCGVLEPGPVNYVKLLERFQDRSDQGKFWYDQVRSGTILFDL